MPTASPALDIRESHAKIGIQSSRLAATWGKIDSSRARRGGSSGAIGNTPASWDQPGEQPQLLHVPTSAAKDHGDSSHNASGFWNMTRTFVHTVERKKDFYLFVSGVERAAKLGILCCGQYLCLGAYL